MFSREGIANIYTKQRTSKTSKLNNLNLSFLLITISESRMCVAVSHKSVNKLDKSVECYDHYYFYSLLLLFLALPVSDFFPLPRLGEPDLSLFLSLSFGDLLREDPGLDPFFPEPNKNNNV